jgi:hypothetical protein
MKTRLFFPTVSLLTLTVLSACAPAAPESTVSVPTSTATAVQAVESPVASEEVLATSTAPPTPVQAIATSRGPELEATDPTTVSLASGQLQLVEFFRFT